jgi:signal transduction histidine kinase
MYQIPIKRHIQATSGSKVKVLLLFIISLGLPSLFLLLLAIRGIKNDQALEEQKLLSHNKEMVDVIVSEVDKEISAIEERLENLLGAFENNDEAERASLMEEYALLSLIDEYFILNDDSVLFPMANLLYRGESSLQPPQNRTNRIEQEQLIAEAERHEFQYNDYGRALELYHSALNSAEEVNSRADLLMRIARVSVRVGNISQAHRTYKAVVEQYNQVRLPSGLPCGLPARLEIVRLTLQADDTNNAAIQLYALYEDLLAGEWLLNKHQFVMARNKIGAFTAELKDTGLSSQPIADYGIDVLNLRADSLVSRTDFLLDLSNVALSVITESIGDYSEDTVICKRYVSENNDRQYLFLIADKSGHPDSGVKCLGALLNEEYLTSTILPNIEDSLSLGDDQSLIVTNRNGVSLYGSPPVGDAQLTVSRDFAGDFPPWTVECYQVDPLFFEQLLSSNRSIYVYALVIVMLALTLGVIITARITARELELARLKSNFVSTVSHEFRSPLTSIRQLSEMLQSGRVKSEERRRHYYDVILEQSERLSLMVSNILDLAGIDERRFRLNREYVRIEDLLRSIISRSGQQADNKKLPVTLSVKGTLPDVRIDPEAITHVMNNLIDNGIKYAGKSPEIVVTAFIDNNDLMISVKDNGIGIPKDEIDKVFERFYRGGDELTRRVKGTGLGLSLVKELIQAHGGSVSLVSEVDKGSTFTIRLPLTKDEGDTNG